MTKLTLALAFSVFTFGVVKTGAAQTTGQNPPITFSILNQTAPVAEPITIFTPNKDGLFRASIYYEITQAGPFGPEDYIGPYLSYTNDSGTVLSSSGLFLVPDAVVDTSEVSLFRAKANTPVTMAFKTVSPPPSGYVYDLYIYIERLQ
jgi:hypothetical protein